MKEHTENKMAVSGESEQRKPETTDNACAKSESPKKKKKKKTKEKSHGTKFKYMA